MIKIPYVLPEIRGGILTKRSTFYIPDFFVVYVDKNNKQHKEIIEIKPKDETPWYLKKVSQLKEARQAMNVLKWDAAMKFCAARGWVFRIATEDQLFGFKKRSMT